MNKKHEWANDLIVMDEWAVQNEIAEKVIELSGINIFEKTRKREVVEIRSLFFFILKDKLNMSWTQIANYFKDSGTYINHATVIHSYNNYEMYKNSNNKMQEIEEMISLKTSMDLKGINKEEYLTLKCKDLEQELDKIKNDSILYKLLNQIPKDKEEEAIMRIELLIKGWEWQYKDSTTAYAGE
jgi:hypothetical protein